MNGKLDKAETGHVKREEYGSGSTTPTNIAVDTRKDGGVAEKDHAALENSHLEDGAIGDLSLEHRDYLIERHGTVALNPIPTMDPADPLNWPSWRKNLNLFLISLNALMTTFTAAAVIPAFEQFSVDLGISLTQASYLTSIQILMLGFAPLFWKPISNRFGRRPIWLISTLGSMICNVGCAKSNSYASQVVTRLLVAFFISPAIAISSAVVTETFFARERGQKLGIWTLMVTLGYLFSLAPFFLYSCTLLVLHQDPS